MEFSEVVRERYSCKSYESRQIEQEKLDQILEAGRLAPTAKLFHKKSSVRII